MSKVPFEAFIESSGFPVGLVSEKSAGEKAGGGRPPYWEMVFWWTRKPLASARAIIAGALIPSSVNVNEFCKVLRLGEDSPHRHNPVLPESWRKLFEDKSLLDPFAGFGSIPLEALRLGLSKVVAVELLPTCYAFLKVILEYPLKYGKQLVEDVEKWGNWITEQLRQDLIIQQLYEPGVAVYIGSWEVKCPHCDAKWTPLVGNWWLARVVKSEGEEKAYARLAWMMPKIEGNKVRAEVVDLNRLLKGEKLRGTRIDSRKGLVTLPSGKAFEVPKSNVDPRREVAVCLHCNNTIRYIDPQTGKHYPDKSKRNPEIKNRLVWYVKYALRKYHDGDPSIAKPIPLVKVRKIGGELEFEPCREGDQKKLEIAKQEVQKFLQQTDPDIPTEPIAPYSNRYIFPILYGMTEWYKLFNHRQTLTLIKLVKLSRKVRKLVEEEKLKKGLSQKEARKYVEAITTCLAIALSSLADFSSLISRWAPHAWKKVNRAFTHRGLSMIWNWCDVNPLTLYIGSWKNCIRNVIDSLKYLTFAVHDPAGLLGHVKRNDSKKVKVLLDNATILSKLNPDVLPNERFDLIVTDPPYYDDVPYTELSDFYFVWLKRALSDITENRLFPGLMEEAFFKQVGAKLVEIRTQWEEFAKQEVSVEAGRFKDKENMKKEAVTHFLSLLTRSFIVMKERLKDDGSLITYYAHTSPEAWMALLEAGWKGGKSHVVNAFPIATESLQRVTARGKYALDTSIVVVWRKGTSGSSSAEQLYDKAVKEARVAALELIKAGRIGSDLFVGTMASILSLFTRYENLYSPIGVLDVKSLVTDYVYPATAKALAMALGEFAGTPGEVKRPESLFYLITKTLFEKPLKAKRKLDRSNTALLSIGTKAELDMLQDLIVLRKEKENFYLEEPATADRKSFEELVQRKDINLAKPAIKSPIDALHLLEYHALTLPLSPFLNRFSQLKGEYSSEVEEAINIAAILAKTLPATDPEKGVCQEIIARIKGEKLA